MTEKDPDKREEDRCNSCIYNKDNRKISYEHEE